MDTQATNRILGLIALLNNNQLDKALNERLIPGQAIDEAYLKQLTKELI